MVTTGLRLYRLILRTYPKGPRREELYGTLVEKGRPSLREAANLIRWGLRARLGRPRSRMVVVVATLVALMAGLFTAAMASRLAVEVSPAALPDAAQLTGIQQVVSPGAQDVEFVRADGVLVQDVDQVTYGSAGYRSRNTAETRDRTAYLAGLQTRLRADGWHIDETYLDDERMWLDARRGSWLMSVETDADEIFVDPENARPLGVEVSRVIPRWVDVVAAAGVLPGLLIGWLLTGWVSRRTEHDPGASARVKIFTAVAFVLVSPNLGQAAVMFGGSMLGGSSWAPFWAPLIYQYELGLLQVAGTVAALAILLDALLAGRGVSRSWAWARR
ncbi:hypothetical protein KOI35_00600 [Actinoplanes bogorensis]|uniref:Uncharacterized protein n=1 Tax=Paractinoplanes bogorensis TaxID=1610840 RepID=A0ABS5YFA8_9ACTN|nr:hypothetical protein [Actinoplanes bogorensis]MBU2661996.1 hypothetical protein [Actinoplanes bogorensis]